MEKNKQKLTLKMTKLYILLVLTIRLTVVDSSESTTTPTTITITVMPTIMPVNKEPLTFLLSGREVKYSLRTQSNELGVLVKIDFNKIEATQIYVEFDRLIKEFMNYPAFKEDEAFGKQYRDWETDRKSTRLNSSHRL